jgi:hypothetical protein
MSPRCKVIAVIGSLAAGGGGPAAIAQAPFGVRTEVQEGHHVRIDERPAVFRVEVPAEIRLGDAPGTRPAACYPSLAALAQAEGSLFPSIAVLEARAKRFDDRVYASVERLLARGQEGRLRARAQVLRDLLGLLPETGDPATIEARAHLLAALSLLCAPEEDRGAAGPRAAALVRKFLDDPLRSKPIGFYAAAEDLVRIFQGDRFLQAPVGPGQEGDWLRVLARVVASAPALRADYERWLRVAATLTNPQVHGSLVDAARGTDRACSVLPASRSREGELFKRLYGRAPIPEDRDLMDDLIAAVRQGRVDLAPDPDSGWYDHQGFALEPLIRPEAAIERAKALRDPGYAQLCEEVFKAVLTKRRETHVKQLEAPMVGAAMPPARVRPGFTIRPRLRCEPQLTYLRRTADAYAFLRRGLIEVLGEEILRQAPLHGSPVGGAPSILAGLLAQEHHFRRIAAQLAQDLGAPAAWLGEGVEEAHASQLAASLDPHLDAWAGDLQEDPRVLVPVAYDLQQERLRCWAIVGLAARPAWISYAKPPALEVRDATGRSLEAGEYDVLEGVQHVLLPYEVWIECSVKSPLSREEFRALCDRHGSAAAIKRALEAL